MRRVLSLKRLSILLAVAVAGASGTVAVHAVQGRRQAAILKTQAEKAEAGANGDPEKLDEAARYYQQYLKYRKTDEDAYVRYAHLMAGRAKADPKLAEPAVQALEGFLRQFPEYSDDRKTLIDLSLKLGRLNTAKQHITMLMEAPSGAFKDDAELLDKAATCELGLGGDFGSAVKYLDRAVRSPKGARPEVAARLLGLLNGNRAYNHPEHTTSEYLDILLTKEPYAGDVAARVVAARFMFLKGETERARGQIDYAINKMPGGAANPDARMAAAEIELVEIKGPETIQPQLQKAEDHLRVAAGADPKNVAAGLMLSRVLADQAKRGEAIDVLRRAAEALGETNDLYLYVVDRLIDLEELDLSARLTDKVALNELDRDRIVKYLRGRTALVKGDFAAARPLLEEVAPLLARLPEFHKKAMAGLGRCYEAVQNPDRSLSCYTDALKDDPAYLPAVVGQAEALRRLGKVKDALPRYQQLVYGYKLEALRPELARMERDALRTQAPAARKWGDFDRAVTPPPGTKRTPELDIIVAESWVARGDKQKAADLLEGLVRADAKNVPAWVALAGVRGIDSPEQRAKTLADAAKANGDTVEIRMAKGVGPLRGRRPTPADLRAALAGSEKFPAPDQNRLLRGVGEAATRVAAAAPDAEAGPLREFAVECYANAAALDRSDLLSRAVLVDLGVMLKKPDVVNRALDGIDAIEGGGGPIGTLGRVIVRLPEVKQIADKGARDAAVGQLRAQAVAAKTARPGWGRAYVALARLDEIEGLTDSALTIFQAAIERGERDEYVVRRAVELLRERKQDDQAAALLNALQSDVPLPEDLERFRAVRDLLARDLPSTERPTIDRVAPADHRDWRVLLLRGSLLGAIGDDEEALKAFQSAVFYGETVPDAWGALVAQQVRLGRTDAAKAALAQAEDRLTRNVPADPAKKAELIDTLATCHELVGDASAAEKRYREAAAVAPQELNPTRQLVLYLQRGGKAPEAEAMLQQLSRGAAGDAARWARRYLALTMLAQADAYHHREAALKLVEQNTPPDEEDKKAKAMVQTIDPRTRAEGTKVLTEYARFGDLNPDQFYHLGKLHFDQGKVFESVEYFEKAARARSGVGAEHLATLARVYLGTGDVARARQTVGRLKAFAPRSWEAAREDARLLKREADDAAKAGKTVEAEKKRDEAKTRVLDFPGAAEDRFARSQSGPLLEELGFYPEVQGVYERLLKDARADDGYAHLPLAAFLINRKRTDEALKLAEERAATAPLEVTARLMTGAVRAKSPGPAAEQKVADWLDARARATTSAFEQVTLLGCKAELLDAQKKYDAAIDTYETVLARAKGLSPADLRRCPVETYKNNLAMLLALHRPAEAGRAIDMMTEVIAVRGPAPAYLDTRAVCYLVKGGRTAEAVEDLKLALVQQNSAGYHFHLGWAYDQDVATRPRREIPLAEARRLGLTAADLHPLEARKFNELSLSR